MSYDVEAARAAGHSDEDIANHLAQTHGYDVLGARKEGYSDADIVKHLAPLEVKAEEKQPSNIALPAELGLLGGAGATAYEVGDIGLKGTRNVVKKVENLLEGMKKPETISAPHPSEVVGPKTPVDKYGKAMHGGVYSHTQDMGQMYKAGEEAQAFKAANPAWEVRQGSSFALPPDLKAAAAARAPQVAPGFLAKAQQMAEPVMSGIKSLGTPLKFAGKVLAPIAGAFEAGTQGGEAWNRGETGDTTGAVISGIGALGSGAMMSGNPFIAIPGAAVSMAAPQINKYRDLVKQGHIKHEAPNYQNFDAMGNAYAHGGLVHLAEGGESNTAPFIGYPRITNKPRDPNFVQQSGPVLGGLDAVLGMGKRDDVSMLTPQGQAYHESYDKYEPVGIAGNVLPFMGGPTKAVGKAALRELGPKAAGMAENYLTKIGGIAHAVPPDTRIMRASEALGPHEGKWLNTTQSDRMRSTEGDLGGPGFSRFQQTDPAYKDAAWGVGQQATASGITNINKKYPEGQAIWSPMIGSETQHHSNQHVHDALTNEFNRQASLGNLPPELRAQMNARLTQYPEYAELFKKGIDVGNPESLKQMGDTFDRRSAISSVISGKGVGGTKGQIFDYPGIMQQMTDPMTIGSPTHSVGTRLFTLNNQVEHRPDLHSAFPYILKGQDQGVAFNPVPKELAIPDWLNLVREFKGREPGYMDYTRGLKGKGTPNQFISEEYLRNLESAGHAEGGSITGYAPGGKVLSALGKSLGEAQAAYKAKFTPDFYHASPSNKIKAFDTQAERNPNFLTALEEESNDLAPRGFVSLTKNPKFANDYATGKNATVYPVSANLGKHLDPRLPENYDVFHQYWKGNPESFPNYYGASHTLPKSYREAEWSVMEDPGFLEHLKNKGYNSMTMVENGQPNVGVFNPADIRGKFAKFNPEDAASPDFMKAAGGSVEGYAPGGSVLSKMGAIAKDLSLPAAENAARTQIIGTLPTYGKAADMLAQRGATGQAIDFGAGLGKGAELLGPGTHTYEPFAQNWNPTYSNAKDIPSDAYGRLTNLNVLNVVPREARDEIVQNIGRVIEPGGQGIITTRGADVMKAQGRPGPEPTSVITSRDTYQKGFSKQELEDYLKYMLGQGYDINKINLGPAGVHIQKKAEGGQPNMQAYAPGASRGIAPYGFRHVENVGDVSLPKGTGWMGALPNQTGGISTEISADSNGSQYPLINPNMNHQDINSLLANQQPTDEMYRKAEQWAKYRQAQGKGPFISPVGELKQPLPKP